MLFNLFLLTQKFFETDFFVMTTNAFSKSSTSEFTINKSSAPKGRTLYCEVRFGSFYPINLNKFLVIQNFKISNVIDGTVNSFNFQ